MHPSLEKHWQKAEALKDDYLKTFAGLSPGQLSFIPAEKEWSLLGVAHHLIKAERGTVKYIRHKLSQQQSLPSTWDNAFKMIGLKIALWLPLKYKVPAKDLHPDTDITLERLQEEWTAARQEMKQVLDTFPENFLDKKIFRHPLAGPMTISQALEFWQYHLQHHAQQLARIRSKADFPTA